MKKIIFSLLSVGLFLFVGCGKDPSEPVDPPNVEKPDLTYNVTEDLTAEIKVITLSWESVRAKSCKLNGDSVALIGSKVFEIPEDVTFTFVVIGDGGTTEKKVDIKAITAPTIPLPKIVYFTTSEDTLPEGGGGAWLSWKVLNAFKDSVSINGIYQTDTIGSYYTGFLSNTGNYVFNLTVIGPGGSKTASITILVSTQFTVEELLCFSTRTHFKDEFCDTTGVPYSVPWSFENAINPCEKDDELTFTTNPNNLFNNFNTLCEGVTLYSNTCGWSLNESVISMQGYSDVWKIVNLSPDTLIYTYPSFRINPDGITVTPILVRCTYVHL